MNKEYVILLYGKTDSLIVNADLAESNGETVKFFKDKDKGLVAEFPLHSVIGYYDKARGRFSYE